MINRADARLTDAAYVELVRGILSTLFLTLIAGAAFSIVGGIAVVETEDAALLFLWAAGVLATFGRIIVLLLSRHYKDGPLTARAAGRIERRFAWSYLLFAAIFGMFMARAFALGAADLRLLVVGIVFGHGAGVAAGTVLRPWIGMPAVLLGVLPTALTAFVIQPQRFWAIGTLILLYMGGGMASMLRRYAATAKLISLENLLGAVSDRDERTGLTNRVAMSQRFEEFSSIHRSELSIALHVIHLEGFSGLNSRHGYVVGDALLKDAAHRLEQVAPIAGFAARLGGVSFALVQPNIDHPRQAEAVAVAAHQALSEPFSASGATLRFDISVGYALALQQGAKLDAMLHDACEARERARISGSGIARSFAVDHRGYERRH